MFWRWVKWKMKGKGEREFSPMLGRSPMLKGIGVGVDQDWDRWMV